MPPLGIRSRQIALESQDPVRSYLRGWHRRFATHFATKDAALFVMRIAFVAVMGLLLYSVQASANESGVLKIQALPAIRDAAERYVFDTASAFVTEDSKSSINPKLIVTAGNPDSRLQLADCGFDLRAFTLNGAAIAARNTIGVRCADEARGAWTIYLPVTVEVEKTVLVLKHSLPRDAHVSLSDVDIQRRRVPGLGASYPSNLSTLNDQHLKRGVAAGAVLSSESLTRDLLVKRGQEVFLVVDVAGVAVRAPGLALADGGYSDRVRVQNRTSLKVVEGIVESGNLVRVGM